MKLSTLDIILGLIILVLLIVIAVLVFKKEKYVGGPAYVVDPNYSPVPTEQQMILEAQRRAIKEARIKAAGGVVSSQPVSFPSGL
jgi:hypothetical protein